MVWKVRDLGGERESWHEECVIQQGCGGWLSGGGI